jgi:catechol 2,3-dioxygenase-like lactoylglutathione lyase family enzyme
MIGYITIGARDTEASGQFYDAVFGAIGDERKFADGGWIGYGPKGKDEHNFYVCPPFSMSARLSTASRPRSATAR